MGHILIASRKWWRGRGGRMTENTAQLRWIINIFEFFWSVKCRVSSYQCYSLDPQIMQDVWKALALPLPLAYWWQLARNSWRILPSSLLSMEGLHIKCGRTTPQKKSLVISSVWVELPFTYLIFDYIHQWLQKNPIRETLHRTYTGARCLYKMMNDCSGSETGCQMRSNLLLALGERLAVKLRAQELFTVRAASFHLLQPLESKKNNKSKPQRSDL